jgi:hypothetical protein
MTHLKSLRMIPYVVAISCVLFLVSSQKAKAVSSTDWIPGRIIDDVVFQDKTAMTVAQIQQFLDSKVPICDTNGSQPMWVGGPTRAQWSIDNGKDTAPYTCLKNYIENPTTKQNNATDPNILVPGGLSAAQLIYNAAQAQNINPQVYLVLLQKEQSLVTDDWPYASQFEKATGNNCPDTAPCDPAYAWLSTQVNNSGAQFNYYVNHFDQYNYAPGWNNILLNPNSSCGSQRVFIENRFTAALYIYTPYVPNQAALNNLYGTGDGCSAYGNRNFWRMFNDWFGSSTLVNGGATLSAGLTLDKPTYVNGDTVTASYQVKNISSVAIDVGVVGVCARSGSTNYDFGTQILSLQPLETKIITFSKKVQISGVLSVFICSYNETLGGWVGTFYPYANDTIARQRDAYIYENPLLINGLSVTPANPSIGQNVTAAFTIQNASSNPVTLPFIAVTARDPSGINVGFPGDSNVTIAPNSTYSYTKVRTFSGAPGTYKFWITALRNNTWDDNYPSSASGVIRQLTQTIYDNPIITTSLTTLPANPSIGQNVTAAFTIQNNGSSPVTIPAVGVAVRDTNGNNVGYPGDTNVVIPANSSYTYTKTKAFTGAPGNYRFFITSLHNNNWDDNYPTIGNGLVRDKSVAIQ